MLITTCPSCRTKYRQKDDKSLDNAKSVECCICGYDWIMSPLNTVKNKDNEFKKINSKLKNIKNQQSGFSVIKKILLAIVAVIAILFFAKQPIANRFPPMAKLYQSLNLLEVKIPPQPVLVFIASNSNKIVNNKNIFKMKIVVQNSKTETLTNPKLLIQMFDLNENLLGAKFYRLNTSIKPKQTKVFNIELSDAKLGTTDFKVKYFK